jgi:16S rRNA A1518/A1519 N6-dimethyltransferase RsmA/KsgA/DIM1 with predicted DNA glycosylase/AP lyase activity
MQVSALSLFALLLKLAPEIRSAVAALVKALQSDDPDTARKAFEAALRLQFVARQKRS